MSMWGTDLERVVAGVATSLENGVLPHVDDHYAQLQIRAARELLLNLSTRIEWQREDLEASVQRARGALAEIAKLDPRVATGGARDADSLVAARADLAEVIDGVYRDGHEPAVREQIIATVWGVVRAEFDAEAQRIQTGMFSSNKPEQEAK